MNLMTDRDYIPKRHPDIISQDIDGESIILDTNGGLLHQLNTTASLIWKNCDGSKSVNDIAIILADNYLITDDAALRDVLMIISNFQVKSLLNE